MRAGKGVWKREFSRLLAWGLLFLALLLYPLLLAFFSLIALCHCWRTSRRGAASAGTRGEPGTRGG